MRLPKRYKRFMKKIVVMFFVATAMVNGSCTNEKEQENVQDLGPAVMTDSTDTKEPEDTPNMFTSQAISLTDNERSGVNKVNDFTFTLFKTIAEKGKGKNVFLSPLSVSYVLGMLSNGATGQTAKEISSLLHIESSNFEGSNRLFQKLISELPGTDSNVELRLANLVAVDKRVTLESTFQKSMEDYYLAKVASLDFAQHSAVDYINDWCNRQTEGMIPEILNYDELYPGMYVSIANAVYFNAPWRQSFEESETKDEDFTAEDGSKMLLPIMHREDVFHYCDTENYSVVSLKYSKGNKWTMNILLPHEGKTVSDVVKTLNMQSWAAVAKRQVTADVDVKLPRFESNQEYGLNIIMADMGASSMFKPLNEFPNICQNTDGFFVSMIKHVAGIKVSEQGTKAAAVTIAGSDISNGDDGPDGAYIIPFHATRPFIYLIQEASSGAIVFIGAYYGQ